MIHYHICHRFLYRFESQLICSPPQTGDVITFAQFEEGNILTETRNNAESCDESDSKSIMINKQDMENIDSNEQSDDDHISMKILEDILDGSQTHPNIDKREAHHKIRDPIKQRKSDG